MSLSTLPADIARETVSFLDFHDLSQLAPTSNKSAEISQLARQALKPPSYSLPAPKSRKEQLKLKKLDASWHAKKAQWTGDRNYPAFLNQAIGPTKMRQLPTIELTKPIGEINHRDLPHPLVKFKARDGSPCLAFRVITEIPDILNSHSVEIIHPFQLGSSVWVGRGRHFFQLINFLTDAEPSDKVNFARNYLSRLARHLPCGPLLHDGIKSIELDPKGPPRIGVRLE